MKMDRKKQEEEERKAEGEGCGEEEKGDEEGRRSWGGGGRRKTSCHSFKVAPTRLLAATTSQTLRGRGRGERGHSHFQASPTGVALAQDPTFLFFLNKNCLC